MRPSLMVLLVVASCWPRTAGAQSCPSGSDPCGVSHCTPDGGVCCASTGHEELSCPSGTTCTADGGCANMSPCSAGSELTLASCGGDSCSCSAPCTTSDDCMSGCCTTAGLCAPSCVCTSSGKLFVQCDTSSAGATGLAPSAGGKKSGCQLVPGAVPAPGGLVLVLLVATAALLARRA